MTKEMESDVQSYFKSIKKSQEEMKVLKKELGKILKDNQDYKKLNEEVKYTKREMKKLKADLVSKYFSEKNERLTELKMEIETDKEALDFIIIKEKLGGQIELPLNYDGETYSPEVTLKFVKTS